MKVFVLAVGLVAALSVVGCGSEDETQTTPDEVVDVDVETSDVTPAVFGKRSEVKDSHD